MQTDSESAMRGASRFAPLRQASTVLCCVVLLAGLEQAGRMRGGETVLVTAAAGGTGQFAVQLAKMAGNQVVATCGSDDKAQLLTDLGCDRVINYNKEQPKVLHFNFDLSKT